MTYYRRSLVMEINSDIHQQQNRTEKQVRGVKWSQMNIYSLIMEVKMVKTLGLWCQTKRCLHFYACGSNGLKHNVLVLSVCLSLNTSGRSPVSLSWKYGTAYQNGLPIGQNKQILNCIIMGHLCLLVFSTFILLGLFFAIT